MNGYMTKYTYSATGQKLAVEHFVALPNVTWAFGVKPNTSQHTAIFSGHTDYLLGGSLIVQEGATKMLLFDGGYAKADRTSYDSTNYGYTLFYYDQDHLGNNRVVVGARGEVQQRTGYYPFGGIIADISYDQDIQKYKYNGKELDRMHGLDTYDYGARQYFSILGRWDRMDPLCEKYYNLSPYNYCGGNPVNGIDPDGCDWISAKYGNELFVYYDSRIRSQDDIIKVYYDDEYRDYYDIQYVGTSGTIYGIINNEEKMPYIALNTDGTYTFDGNTEKSEYCIEGMLHVGTSLQKLAKKENNIFSNYFNYYGYYLGSLNPKYDNSNEYCYAIPPIDNLDYAAFLHDKAYDKKNVSGVAGAFLSRAVWKDDLLLTKRSVRDFRSAPIGSERWKWGIGTAVAFSFLAKLKCERMLLVGGIYDEVH